MRVKDIPGFDVELLLPAAIKAAEVGEEHGMFLREWVSDSVIWHPPSQSIRLRELPPGQLLSPEALLAFMQDALIIVTRYFNEAVGALKVKVMDGRRLMVQLGVPPAILELQSREYKLLKEAGCCLSDGFLGLRVVNIDSNTPRILSEPEFGRYIELNFN